MTGYLARLAARVGGLDGAPSGALRSRPVSRFEEVESDLRVGDAFHDAPDDAVDVAPPSPSRQRPRQYVEGAPPTSSDTRTDRHAGTAPRTAVVAMAEGAATPMAPSVTGPPPTPAAAGAPGAGDDAPSSPSAPPARPAENRPARQARQTAASAVTTVVSERHPVAAAVRPSPSPPTVAAAPVRPARSRPAVPAGTAAAAAADSARQAPPPLRPRVAVPLVSSRIEGREEPSEAATPVVHVTIGRVEVKAVDANAARPAPRRTGPPAVTTLDAYLRRRAREQA